MMAKKPAERFSDPAALLGELHALARRRHPSKAGPPGPIDGSLAEILQAADQRAVATTRLDELMKTTAMVRPNRDCPLRWVAAAMLGCVLLGAASGSDWLRPGRCWPAPRPALPRRDNEWEQIYHAKMVDTQDAWRAVVENFPNAERLLSQPRSARLGVLLPHAESGSTPRP